MTRWTRHRAMRRPGIARNADPRLRLAERTVERRSDSDPYFALRAQRVSSNPLYAYRQFLRRLRQAAA